MAKRFVSKNKLLAGGLALGSAAGLGAYANSKMNDDGISKEEEAAEVRDLIDTLLNRGNYGTNKPLTRAQIKFLQMIGE